MKKSAKIVYVVIIVLAMLAVIGLLIYEIVSAGGQVEKSSLTRGILIFLGLVITLLRVLVPKDRKTSLQVYENMYAEHIRTAFSEPDRQKEKKALLTAIDCYNQDKFNTAIKKLLALRPACRKADDHAAVLLFLALTYTDAGLTSKAIDAYYELLNYDDDRSTVWSNLGMQLEKEGKRREAVNCYQRAINIDPQNPFPWNNLAQAYVMVGEWADAIDPAMKALSLKSNMYQAESALAIAYFAMGDKVSSKKYYELAVMHGSNRAGLDNILQALDQDIFPFD